MDIGVTAEPAQTCPLIDELIRKLDENLRDANANLRDRAHEYQEIAEKYFELAAEWESYALALKEELEDCKREIREMSIT